MRTTVRLDDDLLKSAKRFAANTGRSLTKLIEDALRHTLSRRTVKRAPKSVKLTTVSGRGLRPGVDVDDSAALLAVMERPHSSS
jgi:hypothetical protein